MRTNLSTVLMAMGLLLFAPSAFAQDEMPADPEAGDTGDIGGETGEVGTEGDLQAEPPAEEAGGSGVAKPISVGLLLGYGISLEDGGNAWGLGFGLRGGYNIDAIYLGARFIYYLGDSEDIPATAFTPAMETSVNIWELGIEGGYDVDAGGITIRPGLGVGIASVSVDAGGLSASETYLMLAPGVGIHSIFLGLDVRFQLIFGDPDVVKGLPIFANVGMRF
jgi:hypothetical protein